MTKQEAIKLFEQLVEANMAQGAIKNFATLDKLRGAITVLKIDNNVNEKKIGEGAEKGETGNGIANGKFSADTAGATGG